MKEQILHKACDMFLNLGFKSVTMDDLAHELGISKKTIYTHYDNKTKLVKACTEHLFGVVTEGINCIIEKEENPIKELYDIKRFVMERLKDEKMSPQYQLQKFYPKISQELNKKQLDTMLDCVIENVQRGVKSGLYRENLNTEFVARIYFAGFNSIKDEMLFPARLFTKPELMDTFLEYHLRGIVTPKGRKILNEIINSNQE